MNQHSKIKAAFLDKTSQVIFLDKKGSIIESDNCLFNLSEYVNKPIHKVFPKLNSQKLEGISDKHPVEFPMVSEILGNKGPFRLLGRRIKEAKRTGFILFVQQTSAPNQKEAQPIDKVFVTSISHKLRTPMNAILGFTELLRDSTLNDNQHAYLDFINSAGENLLNLLNDVLEYIKIDAGQYEVQESDFKLKESIDDIVDDCKKQASEKQLRFYDVISPQLPELVRGDQKLLIYVLRNLLQRAVKFTDSGFVEIMAKSHEGKRGQLVLELVITDSGKVSPEIQNTKTLSGLPYSNIENTGLELAVAGKLAKLNKGKITVSSNNANGNQYTIHLNFKTSTMPPKPTGQQDQQTLNPSGHNLKILLAEDLYINQILTEKMLMKYDCDLEIVSDGMMVIERLHQKPYDLILMDLQMPEMDGYETTEYIRTKMPTDVKSIPIIALTAHAINGEKEKCLKRGMNDYLAKPFRSSELYAKINGLFSKRVPISADQIHATISLNLDYLRKTFRGNPSFLVKVIENSLGEIPHYMSKLSLSIDKKNPGKVVETMTKLKSIFRLLGLYELAGMAHSVEKKAGLNIDSQINAIEEDIGNIEHWIPDIMEQLMIELRKIESFN